MTRNPRKLVDHFESQRNTGFSWEQFPVVRTAHLQCGHVINMGVGTGTDADYRPKRMACVECGNAGESREYQRNTAR